MSRKQKAQEPDVIRLSKVADPVIPGFTITNLSEADIRALRDGYVPTWVIQTADWWLRDNPRPSDKPPSMDAVDPVVDSHPNGPCA